jgi:hypothetical protein
MLANISRRELIRKFRTFGFGCGSFGTTLEERHPPQIL